ncbi:MAG: hypothetical protein HY966_05070 [Ignavibacteriales bacterium]|nr:hypothetical protein [Ignavibacteriales bacterium]
MNTGQTMMVIAAFALLSMLTLAVNSTMIMTSTLGLETQTNLNALSIAQSMLDEIQTQEYDEYTTNSQRAFQFSSLTTAASFGPDAGETFAGIDKDSTGNFKSKRFFDDVDDYHLYHRQAYDARLGWFDVVDTVQYVQNLNPDAVSLTQTWHKRIIVTVTHYAMNKKLDGTIIPLQLYDCSVYRKYF